MAQTTKTVVDSTIQEVWSKLLVNDRNKNLVFSPLMDHRYEREFAGTPTDTIHVPGFAHMASAAGAWSSGATTYRAVALNTSMTITPTRHYYQAVAIDRDAEFFSSPSVMSWASDEISYQVALEEDTYLGGLVSSFSNPVGTLGAALTDEDIIEAKRLLNTNLAPFNDRFFVFSEDQDAEFSKVERYVNADYQSAIGSVDGNRTLGKVTTKPIHGFQWYMTTNVTANGAGHDNAFFQREAIAVVDKQSMRSEGPFYDIDSDSEKIAVHNIYGATELRDGYGVWGKGL